MNTHLLHSIDAVNNYSCRGICELQLVYAAGMLSAMCHTWESLAALYAVFHRVHICSLFSTRFLVNNRASSCHVAGASLAHALLAAGCCILLASGKPRTVPFISSG